MATFDLSCPECGNTSKVPDDLVGKKIKCKKCQKIIVVQAPKAGAAKQTAIKAAPPANKTKGKDEDDDKNPYIMQEVNLAARCPHCALPMDPPDAKVCIHCGYHMQKRQRVEQKVTYEVTAVDYLIWHLPTFGCFIGIMILIGICVFCGINMSEWIPADFFVKPGCFTTWIVIICCYPMFVMARFIFRRLVWNFTPKEQEKKKSGELS
jgi:hypothetical protein